jgi:hypothetical protein
MWFTGNTRVDQRRGIIACLGALGGVPEGRCAMRYRYWMLPAFLLFGGCYAEPAVPGYGYAAPGYPSPYGAGYPAGGYSEGPPAYVVGGAPPPMIFYGGQWGYWDHDHHWQHAPDYDDHHWRGQNASAPPPPHDEHWGRGQQPSHQGQPVAVNVPHAAPPPRPAPQNQGERHHNCPPGQGCY